MIFKQVVLEVMKFERELVFKYRAEGHNLVKPSTLLLILFCLFYTLSGIDLLPEAFIPVPLGYLDDLAIIVGCSILVFSDLSDVDLVNLQVAAPINLERFKRKDKDSEEGEDKDLENASAEELISENADEEMDDEIASALASLTSSGRSEYKDAT